MLTLKLIQKNQNYSIFHFILFCRYFFLLGWLVEPTQHTTRYAQHTNAANVEQMKQCGLHIVGSGIALAQLRLLFQRTKLNSTNTHRNENLIILISPLTFFVQRTEIDSHPLPPRYNCPISKDDFVCSKCCTGVSDRNCLLQLKK